MISLAILFWIFIDFFSKEKPGTAFCLLGDDFKLEFDTLWIIYQFFNWKNVSFNRKALLNRFFEAKVNTIWAEGTGRYIHLFDLSDRPLNITICCVFCICVDVDN